MSRTAQDIRLPEHGCPFGDEARGESPARADGSTDVTLRGWTPPPNMAARAGGLAWSFGRCCRLIALCNRLEASLTDGGTARTRLLDALLHEALEPVADRLEAAA
jgi:hypothetical protein